FDSPIEGMLAERQRAGKDTNNNELSEIVEALRTVNPNHELVKKYDRDRARPKGQEVIETLNSLLAVYGSIPADAPRRWAVEQVTLMDYTSVTDTVDIAAMLRRRGDEEGAAEIERTAIRARELMGIRRIRVINDFPLTLAA